MNIVFDIGNVICEWNAEKLTRKVFSSKSEQKMAMEQIIGHEDWLNLDRGTLSLEEASTRAIDRTGIKKESVQELYQETPRSLVPFPETIALIKELEKSEHKLYVLSNMHQHAYEYLTKTYDFWSCFSGIVISSHIQTIKPEPEIYAYLIKKWHLIPTETIFLDDLKENLSIARTFGIKTLLVNSPKLIKNDLEKILVAKK